ALQVPRIGEVAVVRDVDPVRPGPHERADYGLGEEEPVRVSGLDRCDTRARSDSHDSDAVRGRSDDAGRVGPVAVVVLRGGALHGRSAYTVGAVRDIDVGLQVRVREVDPGVDVADEHAGARVDGVSVWYLDLRHVPLPVRQAVAPGGGHARVVRRRAGSLLGQVGCLDAELVGGGHALDP